MTKTAKTQWVLIGGAGLLVLLILFSPRSTVDHRFSELSPEEASVTLGLVYMNEMPMKGIKLLDKAVKIHPEYTLAIGQLADFSMKTGQFEKAVGRYEQLVAKTQGREQLEAMLMLSDAQFLTDDTGKSINTLEKVFEMSKDSLLLQSVSERIKELKKL